MITETPNTLTRDTAPQDVRDSADIGINKDVLLPIVELEGLSDLQFKWLARCASSSLPRSTLTSLRGLFPEFE